MGPGPSDKSFMGIPITPNKVLPTGGDALSPAPVPGTLTQASENPVFQADSTQPTMNDSFSSYYCFSYSHC